MPKQSKSSLLLNQFFATSQQSRRYQRKWLSDQNWVTLINTHFPSTGASTKVLNRAFTRVPEYSTVIDLEVNDKGIYRKQKFDSQSGRKCWYYQVRKAGEPLPAVNNGEKWWDQIIVIQHPDRSVPVQENGDEPNTSNNEDTGVAATVTENERNNDRARKRPTVYKCAELILEENFWEQGEARSLFDPKNLSNSVLDAIDGMLKILGECNQFNEGWRNVVKGVDPKDLMKPYDVFVIRQKSLFIMKSLQIAKEKMNGWTWSECCSTAVTDLNALGFKLSTNAEIVCRWFRDFRDRGNFFADPNAHPGRRMRPHLFEHFPDAEASFCKYADENLPRLSGEFMTSYLIEQVIPALRDKHNTNTTAEFALDNTEDFLSYYGYKQLHVVTVTRWMNMLGYRYDIKKKHYFNDKHEEESNVLYRGKFIERYLKYEGQSFRWIQITRDESAKLIADGNVLPQQGYQYVDDQQQLMTEYHVDDWEGFHERMEPIEFGGNLSVRRDKEKKPIIILGQDECIYKQFLFKHRHWIGRNGERPLLPKDEGQGIMLSAFQSREFGFGFRKLTESELESINMKRLSDVTYKDVEAAIKLGIKHGKKMPLSNEGSRFVVKFQYGASFEGYWSYEHMVIQLEDIVDILTVLHPHYQFVFLFDHSCGHDRQQEDGLNANRVIKGYGGSSPTQRASKIAQAEGYLGPHEHDKRLQVHQIQSMVFERGDVGPCWMTPDEQERNKYDVIEGEVEKTRNKDELITHLSANNLPITGTKTELQSLCGIHGIPTRKLVSKVKEGWWGKQGDSTGRSKGSFQILWERGWIDPLKSYSDYTLDGKKNNHGNIMKETSLKYLMSQLYDYSHEETSLQKMGRDMEVIIDRTPKCHCEIAGEGIEYSWGLGKNKYRALPIVEKKGKTTFHKSVQKCTSRDTITISFVRKASRRAREYMVSYKLLADGLYLPANTESDSENQGSRATPIILQKVLTAVRTHRCAMDFDHRFIVENSTVG